MALVKLEDIEASLDSNQFTGAIEEEVDTINQTINESVVAINQSVEAVRRLIIVRDALQNKETK